MWKFIVSAVITGGMAAAALGLAGAAAADTGAADTVAGLQAQGYSVQVNGQGSVPLSDCTINGVQGVSDANAGGTVYVDASCRGGC